jgi:chromosome segregation ATPase
MAQGNYLDNLEQGLNKLRELVDNSKTNSGDFNQKVIAKIRTIDDRLALLREQVVKIVDLVNQLRLSIKTNTLDVDANKEEIQRLTQQIAELNQEKETLNAEIARLSSGQSEASAELTKQIQSQEAKILELTQKMEQREAQILEQQKIREGEFSTKEAANLQKIQELGQQIEEMKLSVAEKENQLAQINQQMAQSIQEKQNEIDQLRAASGGVNEEMVRLQNENKQLIAKIIDSTNVIVAAVNALDEIRNQTNPENLPEIDAKIAETNKIVDELTDILTGASSGNGPSQPQPQPQPQQQQQPQSRREDYYSGTKNSNKKGGFFANFDVEKNRKSRKSSNRSSSRSSRSSRSSSSRSKKSKRGKKTRKQKRRSSFRF